MKRVEMSEKLLGLALVAVALVVYVVTLSSGAFPGASASLVASHVGLIPRFSPASPVWTGMVALVRAVSGEHFILVLNLISAVCAAGAVGLLYALVREGVAIFIDDLGFTENRRRVAALLAGSTAAISLAFCIPFWIVANRAHTAALDVLLLLLAARILLAYMDYGKLWIALLFSLLFGVGVVEFATFIVVAPLFGAWLLYVMWKRDVLRMPVVLALIGCAVVGLLVYLLAAWGFYNTPGYELRRYDGFFEIVWHLWREQYMLISRSLPKEGWLIIVFVTVVPWLAMLSVARRGLNDERDWGLYLLHTIMTALAVAVLLNTPIAPFPMLGMGRLLVTPYILVAMVYGYLVAYWFLLPSGWGRDPEASITRFFRNIFGWVLIAPLVGLLVWVPFRNSEQADTKQTRFVNACADEVIECLDGREWLISDGVLDNHLLLAASRKDIPLRVINVSAGNSSVYLDYLASQLEETRMQNLVKVGIPALLGEWMLSDPDVHKKIAVLAMPDLWARYGFVSVPNRMVFLASKEASTLDLDSLIDDHHAFWKRFGGILEAAAAVKGENPWYKWGKRHAGLVANNFGVLLEDSDRLEPAYAAYQAARSMDADNVSALLNMAAMVDAGRISDPDGEVKADLDALEAGMEKKYHIWSLARYYGTVRAPEAFAQLGWTWAYSGQAGMAISELEKAADMLPSDRKGDVQELMADIFLQDNRATESEAIYREILARDKDNQAALLGMMRIRLGQRKFKDAEGFLSLAADRGVSAEHVELQRAGIAFASGDLSRAKEILDELLQANRKLLRGWVLLADIAFAEQDERALDKSLRRLSEIEGDRGYFGSVIRGRRALKERDVVAGVEHFETALAQNRTNRGLVEVLLRLEMALGNREAVRGYVKTLLEQNPNHAFALYVRGSLQLAVGELELAEDSLRNSLRGARSPMALNDLAWLVQARGDFKEAEKLIDEALALDEKGHAQWDTKGVILMKTERYEEAVEAFGRSLAIFDKMPSVHLHMGEAQLALGHKDAVRKVVELVSPQKEALSTEDREILSKLQAGVTE
jgi:tetratricopeptide (TPR) repeat protein